MTQYLVPFSIMDSWLTQYALPGSTDLDLPYQSYLAMIRRLIEPVPVDEAWYRSAYPGIANAIARGVFRSAGHHFLAHGYFEDRLPFAADRSDLRQPVPFAEIRSVTTVRPVRGGLHVQLERTKLTGLVERLLQSVPVDEAWYRRTYPGVAEAIASGAMPSATRHFTRHGYMECRWPFPMEVDETWYLARYPEVRHALVSGPATSAQEHFWRFGYREGRFPTRTPVL